jgi:hypothetical protein
MNAWVQRSKRNEMLDDPGSQFATRLDPHFRRACRDAMDAHAYELRSCGAEAHGPLSMAARSAMRKASGLSMWGP